MTDFRDFPINFILAGLFLTSMISFGVIIGTNYGKEEGVMKSDKIDFTAIEDQLSNNSAEALKWKQSFTGDNPLLNFGALILFSIWGISKLMWGTVSTMLSIFLTGLGDIIGVSPLVIGSITAIIIIALIFGLWKVIKAGN